MTRAVAVGTALLGGLLFVAASSSRAGTPPAPVRDLSKKAVWMMGTDLGYAAVANGVGVSPSEVQKNLTRAKRLAEALGVAVPDLPKPQADKTNDLTAAIAYLLDCKTVTQAIMGKHGVQHAALFDLALRLQMLRVLYTPGDSRIDSLRDSIEESAIRAGLPSPTWRPVLDSVARKAAPAVVYAALDRATRDVAAHLDTAAPAVAERDPRSEPAATFSIAATPAARYQIWRTGYSLGFAGVKRVLGTNDLLATAMHAAGQSSAAKLGVAVPDVPPFEAGATVGQKGVATVKFLLGPSMMRASDAIEAKYGAGGRALFELGMKSQLTALVYAPGSDFGASLATGLERASRASGLPETLWSTTLTKMRAGASTNDVVASANRMCDQIDARLRNAAARK